MDCESTQSCAYSGLELKTPEATQALDPPLTQPSSSLDTTQNVLSSQLTSSDSQDREDKKPNLQQQIVELTTPCRVVLDGDGVSRYLQPKVKIKVAEEGAARSQYKAKIKYTCKHCLLEYGTLKDLEWHLNYKERTFKGRHCGICDQNCATPSCLQTHLINVHNIHLSCNILIHLSTPSCNHEISEMQLNVLKTNQNYETDAKVFVCKLCNYELLSDVHLLCHVKQYHYIKKCYNCGRCFEKTCNLLQHIQSCVAFHGTIDHLKCDLLQFQFKINTCPFCLYEASQVDLDLHMKMCKNCPRINATELTDFNVGSGSNNIGCPLCKEICKDCLYYQHLMECNALLGAKTSLTHVTLGQLDETTWSLRQNNGEVKCEISQTEQHFLNVNNKTCEICNLSMKQWTIKTTFNKKFNIRNYCQICYKYIVVHTKKSLKNPMAMCQCTFACKNCGVIYRSQLRLKYHQLMCGNTVNAAAHSVGDNDISELYFWKNSKFHCSTCSYTTPDETLIKLHVKAYHTKCIKFVCDLCNNCFNSKQEMETHFIRKHLSPGQLNSNSAMVDIFKCGSVMSTTIHENEMQLGNFMSVMIKGEPNLDEDTRENQKVSRYLQPKVEIKVGEEGAARSQYKAKIKYSCKHCLMSYSTLKDLTWHLNYKERTFKGCHCGICDQNCATPSCLQIHLINVHNIHLSCNNILKHPSTPSCNHEISKFLSKSLKMNQNYETVVKVFVCNLCDQELLSDVHLLCHVKQYHYIKKCYNCGRCFEKTCNLLQHIQSCVAFHGKIDHLKCDLLQFQFKINTCPFCLYEASQVDLDLHMKMCKNCPRINATELTDFNVGSGSNNIGCPLCKEICKDCLYYQHLMECNALLGAKTSLTHVTLGQLDETTWSLRQNYGEVKCEISQIEQHFSKVNDKTCEICNLPMKQWTIKTTLNKKLQFCKICYKFIEFNAKKSLENPMAMCQCTFACKNCSAIYRSRIRLKYHHRICGNTVNAAAHSVGDNDISGLYIWQNSKFHCSTCSYTTPDETLIKLHVKAYHTKCSKFVCDLCNNCFNSKQEMETHFIRKHLSPGQLNSNSAMVDIFKCGSVMSTTIHENEMQLGNFMSVTIKGEPNLDEDMRENQKVQLL